MNMFNPTLLSQLLQTPAYSSLSDAAAATALSAPVLTPLATPVTAASVASVLGFAAAVQIMAALDTATEAGQVTGAAASVQQFGASAALALTILGGSGLNPADPQSQAAGAAFVAAGILTQAQLNSLFYSTSYPAGDVVATADVTAARATIALQTAAAALTQQVIATYNNGVNAIQAGVVSGTLPTASALRAL